MEFCDQSWSFTNFAPELYQICIFFVTNKKLSSDLESPYFPRFSAKRCECNIGKRDGHRKIKKWSWKSHGKIFVQVCGNPVKGTKSNTVVIFFTHITIITFDPAIQGCENYNLYLGFNSLKSILYFAFHVPTLMFSFIYMSI